MATNGPSDEYLEWIDEMIGDAGLPPPKNEAQRIAAIFSAFGMSPIVFFARLRFRSRPPSVLDVCELFHVQWSDVLRSDPHSTWSELEEADTEFQDWLSARKRRGERERNDTYLPMTDHARNPGLTRGKP